MRRLNGGWGRRRGYCRRRWRRLWFFLLPLALIFLLVEIQLSPLIEAATAQRAHSVALRAMTEAVNETVTVYQPACDYQQLMHIERDGEGRITLIAPDTMLLNELISATVTAIESALSEIGEQRLSLPLGSITGSSLFSALGPDLHVRFRMIGAPSVEIADDFTAAGINQVRHRIYLTVSSELRLIAPFTAASSEVSTTVLLCEGIIVGYTPEAYFELHTE